MPVTKGLTGFQFSGRELGDDLNAETTAAVERLTNGKPPKTAEIARELGRSTATALRRLSDASANGYVEEVTGDADIGGSRVVSGSSDCVARCGAISWRWPRCLCSSALSFRHSERACKPAPHFFQPVKLARPTTAHPAAIFLDMHNVVRSPLQTFRAGVVGIEPVEAGLRWSLFGPLCHGAMITDVALDGEELCVLPYSLDQSAGSRIVSLRAFLATRRFCAPP